MNDLDLFAEFPTQKIENGRLTLSRVFWTELQHYVKFLRSSRKIRTTEQDLLEYFAKKMIASDPLYSNQKRSSEKKSQIKNPELTNPPSPPAPKTPAPKK